MIFRSVFDLRDYTDRLIGLGLGSSQPMLDRRGCDCGVSPAPAGIGPFDKESEYM